MSYRWAVYGPEGVVAWTLTVFKHADRSSIFRLAHIVFSIPILGYIYSPFEKLPDYAPQLGMPSFLS